MPVILIMESLRGVSIVTLCEGYISQCLDVAAAVAEVVRKDDIVALAAVQRCRRPFNITSKIRANYAGRVEDGTEPLKKMEPGVVFNNLEENVVRLRRRWILFTC